MTIQQQIEQKLKEAFHPLFLEVIDQSHLHEGHEGKPSHSETHFNITIVSAAFKGLSRLTTHQKIYAVLHEEVSKIHALSISAKAP